MVNSPERKIYRFENIEVDIWRGYLKRDGAERHLRRQAFQVPVYLLEHRGSIVTKDELIHEVWRSSAVVDDVLVQSVKAIRRVLNDNSQHPRFIRTIPKIGYHFIGTVEEVGEQERWRNGEKERSEIPKLESGVNQDRKPKTKAPSSLSLFKSRPVLLSISALVVIPFLLLFLSQSFRYPASQITLTKAAGQKTLVVMFFENQSGNTKFDWLREGLPDMLITNLSRSDRLSVLSRGQLHVLLNITKRNPAEKIPLDETLEIARRAGAETAITGSFAELGEKMRLEVQLYDTKTGKLSAAESLTVDRNSVHRFS